MVKKDKRIDNYIAQAQPFAKPILNKLRSLIHKGNPDVEETIKWGMPFFTYKGPFCSFAGFKEHTAFRFWKYQLINDPGRYLQEISNRGGKAMGNLGQITSLKDLPPDDVILDFIKQAKKLNDEGAKQLPRPKEPKRDLELPGYLIKALHRNKAAEKSFNDFSYSHKKEYLEWITEAKTEATRNKRLETALDWMSQGKIRNWKYNRK